MFGVPNVSGSSPSENNKYFKVLKLDLSRPVREDLDIDIVYFAWSHT